MTSIIGTPVLIDDGTYNGAYTPESGSEGVLIVFSHEQSGASRHFTAGTLGGQALENVLRVERVANASTSRIVLEAWVLKSAGIAAMSGNALAMVPNASGNDDFKGVAYSLDNWDQVTPLVLSVTDSQLSSTDLSLSATPPNGSLVIGAWACSNANFGMASGKNLSDYGFAIDRIPSNSGTGLNIHTGYRNSIGHLTASGGALAATLDSATSDTDSAQVGAFLVFPAVAATVAPTLSSATPSGTIATQQSATIGATTDQATGTLYTVLSATQSHITDITSTQLKAAQISSGAAASASGALSGNGSVSSVSPTIPMTGLQPGTTYWGASVQSNANGDSNVVTFSFTTAAASRSVTFRLRSRATGPFNNVTMRFFTAYTTYGAAVDGGTNGLEFTSNSSGYFTLTGLTINAGAGEVRTRDPADPTRSIIIPVTFVSGA